MIGGHRGFGGTDSAFAQGLAITKDKPVENTAESIQKAFLSGAQFVEFDTVKTKDGHVVVIHSNRLSDHFFTPLKHEFIADLTLAEIQAMPAGVSGKGRISTLNEILRTIKEVAEFSNDFVANIEIKDVKESSNVKTQSPKYIKGEPSLVECIATIIRDEDFPLNKIVFSSFSYIDLVNIKKVLHDARVGALFEVASIDIKTKMYPNQNIDEEEYLHFTKGNIEKILKAVELEAVHPYFHDITDDMITFCGEKNLTINAWFYKEAMPEENKEKILHVMNTCKKHNVTFNIMTDYTPEMLVALGR